MDNRKNYSQYLNASGKLARAFIRSKLTLLIIVLSLLLGLMALLFTPRTYNPEIVVPVVNISVGRPGSDANEMLHQVVRPLESLMHAISGVDHTYGIAMNDKAIVTVRFKVNENEENSLVKVYDQINKNMDKIPPGTTLPLIQSVSLYDVPIVTITLSGKDKTPIQLREIGNKLLTQLRSVPHVGNSWIIGSSPTSIKLWLDPKKIKLYKISIQQIKQALQANNVGMTSGSIKSSKLNIPIRTDALFTKASDISSIVIGLYNGKPILLSDIATIKISPKHEDLQSFFAYGKASKKFIPGKLAPSITLAFARKKGSNGVEVAAAILKRFNEIKKQEIPNTISTTVTRDYGLEANNAVNTLVEHLGIAIGSVIILLLIFLGWREASIVTFSIPLILFVVLGIGWILGQTINRITLFSLILSLGLLVDDSIVVIENIHRNLSKKPWHNFTRTIVIAANEIGRPTIIATFTVILALIPMAFVTGMMGPFMGPIPFNAPLAMIISLLIAYTVVPYLAYSWLRKKALSHRHETNFNGESSNTSHTKKLQKFYHHLFKPLVFSKRKRFIFYIVIALLPIIVMLQPLWQFIRPHGTNGPMSPLGVELKMLPDDNVNTFLIEIDAPTGSNIQITKKIAFQISRIISKNKYIKNYQIYFGKSAPNDFAAMVRGDSLKSGDQFAQIRINLINKHKRSVASHKIAQTVYQSLLPIIDKYPKTKIKLYETPPGPPVRSQMEGAIYSDNYQNSERLALKISGNIYPKIYGMINIDSSVEDSVPQYKVFINQDKATSLGLSPSIISNDIYTYFHGDSLGILHQQNASEPRNIILKLPRFRKKNIDDLKDLYFNSKLGDLVSLNDIATIHKTIANRPIFTRDQYTVSYVTGEMLHSSPVNGVVTTTGLIKKLPTPNGKPIQVINLDFADAQPNPTLHTQFSWLGEMRLTLDVFRDLGSAFIVALVLIYLLLTGFYRSFATPIIIMGAIPLTIIGVFPGHWIMQQPFTATSMIGVIALSGIVVRNSLLLIDFILNREKEDVSLEKAIIEAATVRLTPILLTALAIIFGSAIMISDPVFGGLAISLIFGTIASTILTLFVIPLVYYSWKIWQRKH